MSTDSTTSRFAEVDPRELIVGTNARTDPRLTKEFKESIRERGVLQAVTAYRDEQERLVVLFGQCRTIAAVEVGRPTVPVMVVDRPEDVDRIGDQVVENDQRAELTTGDRVAAFQQMAAFGVSAAQIAKRTGHRKDDVATALTVASSELARKATQRYDFLDLHQAAVVAEFEDEPEAVKALIVAARNGRGFDHEAQRLRDKRTEKAERDALVAELTAGGLTIVAEPQSTDPKVRPLSMLNAADGTELDSENHRDCPGHAAYVVRRWHMIEVPADDEDEQDDDGEQDDQESGEVRTVFKEVLDWMPKYVCTDFVEHGHRERYTSSGTGQKKVAADMSEEQREAERAKRRDVIQANKDWLSATTVRREWLRTLAARKTAPKTAARFLAGTLARPGLSLANGYGLAYGLLDLQGRAPAYGLANSALADLIDKSSEARAQVLSLVMVLAALEEPLKLKDSWRNASSDTVRYLRFLESCGYGLSAVELRACGEVPQPAETGDTEDKTKR